MHFSFLFAFVAASIGAVVATPTPAEPDLTAHGGPNGEATLTTQAGCGAVGPLTGPASIWWIVRTCKPGARMICQATDQTGCIPGSPVHISSLEVDDPNDTFNIAFAPHTNTLPFICPAAGAARCQVHFDGANVGKNYGLRVFPFA
ncbi:hypothetical protein C8Q77DRAFT_1231076 [Trametes polyzona]|nr:hypothetical protein C8Q77DRAFT_1231076 [Trametes polyzona]